MVHLPYVSGLCLYLQPHLPISSSHFPLAQGLPAALAPSSLWPQCLHPDTLLCPECSLTHSLSDGLANSYSSFRLWLKYHFVRESFLHLVIKIEVSSLYTLFIPCFLYPIFFIYSCISICNYIFLCLQLLV